MKGRLQGRRAVITGAAQGIGYACAKRFLDEGAKVVIADIDEGRGVEARKTLGGADGSPVAFVKCDVAKRAEIESAIGECADRWGGIDVLVNNAGIANRGDILALEEGAFQEVIGVNLVAAFNGTQIASRRMVEQGGGGVIINMSSVNAVLNIPHLLAYNVSKGGLNQLTSNAAIALAKRGIRVCGIGPGTILTELTRNSVWTDDAARRSILSRTPIGRPGKPEEIAAIAAFLASDDASYLTGITIYADGGRLGLNYTVPVEL